jgi:hypothetical protein
MWLDVDCLDDLRVHTGIVIVAVHNTNAVRGWRTICKHCSGLANDVAGTVRGWRTVQGFQ